MPQAVACLTAALTAARTFVEPRCFPSAYLAFVPYVFLRKIYVGSLMVDKKNCSLINS